MYSTYSEFLIKKVVTGLQLQGSHETATFVQNFLDWWNIVHNSAKGKEKGMNDPIEVFRTNKSTNLNTFCDKLKL